jgi:murein DD-endopeptidase MepM/ murein hydrolase activator NlpD
MSRIIKLVGCAAAVAALTFAMLDSSPPPAPPAPVVVAAPVPQGPVISKVPHQIQPGETLGTILQNFGLPARQIREAALPITDLAKIRAGRSFTFVLSDQAPTPYEIHYPMGEDKTLVLKQAESGWTAQLDTVEYTVQETVREFTVTSSFWAAAVKAGLRASDIAGLANVYRFDVDFNTELRKGATVRMWVQELSQDGQVVKLGRPLAVRFTNSGKEYTAIHHVSANGEHGYFDAKGITRKKAFLRSPLKFSKVTSKFNRKRFHPILKKRRPHLGVDFGAKTGTPVQASGGGVVVFAGRKGGHGKYVKIDHNGPYMSSYSHLSKISVKKGQKIRQGQLVGKVGSTGMSTGPHLHYQFWSHGKIVNPMTVKLPRNEAMPSKERPSFEANRDRWLEHLDSSGPALAEATAG